MREEVQQPDGRGRQARPTAGLLQRGPGWQEVVEINLWGSVEHWHHQCLHPLEDGQQPPVCPSSHVLAEDVEVVPRPRHDGRLSSRVDHRMLTIDNLVVDYRCMLSRTRCYRDIRWSGSRAGGRCCKHCARQKNRTVKARFVESRFDKRQFYTVLSTSWLGLDSQPPASS